MKVYKIGIIGYGGFGQFLHHWWDRLDRVKVIAVATGPHDHNDYPGIIKYGDWHELIADPQLDIVSIATPPAFHVEMAAEAMRAGKHVLVEKPVALSASGVEELLDVQRETGKVILVDHMLRYNPIVGALIHFGKQQAFGKLRHVSVTNYAQDSSLPADHWFWDREQSGGIFVEHGVHFFDIVNSLTDQKVAKIHGVAHRRNDRQQDQVSAMVLYDGGLVANHYHSFSGPGFFEETTIRLMYDLAKVEVSGWIPLRGKISALVDDTSLKSLDTFPGLQVKADTAIGNLIDLSRPEGWGDARARAIGEIEVSGLKYSIERMVSAEFSISDDKSAVYGSCIQAIMLDLIAKIEDPSHRTKVSIIDAYEALKHAVSADSDAMR